VTAKNLILFTAAYPYGTGEQFIETEILYVSKAFENVFIYPLVFDNKPPRTLPENVKVVNFKLFKPHNRLKTLLSNLSIVTKIVFFQIFRTKHGFSYLTKVNYYLNKLLNKLNDAQCLEKELNNYPSQDTVLYSYWFNTWADTILLMKQKNESLHCLARIHGGDYDTSRRADGIFPFREFFYNQETNIASISNYGVNFINNIKHRSKVSLQRLGVMNQGINPFNNTEQKVIVSCASMIEIKRLPLLIDVLSKVTAHVKWIHFGDGELEKEVKLYANNKLNAITNIDYEFKGHCENSDVMKFYAVNPVDIFMSTSSIEGIPVSMMEAISFGIPIVGCDVGGVSEVVTKKTGFLLPKNVDINETAIVLDTYFNSSVNEQKHLRESAKLFWNANFNADLNYSLFNDYLQNLLK
jgi:glycosyltransferase involved in cell wall biosynthesis